MYDFVGRIARIKHGLSSRWEEVWGKEVLIVVVTAQMDGSYSFEVEFLDQVSPYITKGYREEGWKEWELDFPALEHIWEV